jgi:hypothetical protein
MTETLAAAAGPTLKEQGGALLAHAAGYASHRTIAIGLRSGLLEALGRDPAGATAEELAERLGLGVVPGGAGRRGLRARRRPLRARPARGHPPARPELARLCRRGLHVLEQPEMFGHFEANLASGERLWWDECSPDWIAGVAGTGTPFYTRLIPGGLGQVPGLTERLAAGGLIVDSACGAGAGLVRLAQHFPACRLVGVDGDAHSIELARARVAEAGLADRIRLIGSPLEEMAWTSRRPWWSTTSPCTSAATSTGSPSASWPPWSPAAGS